MCCCIILSGYDKIIIEILDSEVSQVVNWWNTQSFFLYELAYFELPLSPLPVMLLRQIN